MNTIRGEAYFLYYSNYYLLIDYIIFLDPYSFSFANTNSLAFSFYFSATGGRCGRIVGVYKEFNKLFAPVAGSSVQGIRMLLSCI